MSKQELPTFEAEVIEALPNTEYIVRSLEDGTICRCILAGKMKFHRIRVMLGDKVRVERIPNASFCRITFRL
jgi:translation initiation factor IF-1